MANKKKKHSWEKEWKKYSSKYTWDDSFTIFQEMRIRKEKQTNVSLIERRLYEARQVHQRRMVDWHAFFESLPKPVDYDVDTKTYGIYKGRPICFNRSSTGVSHDWLDDKVAKYARLSTSQLLLHVNDVFDKKDKKDVEAETFFHKRLSGEITYQNAIIRRYFSIESKLEKVYKVLRSYRSLYELYIGNKYTRWEKSRGPYNRVFFCVNTDDGEAKINYSSSYMWHTVNGRRYLWSISEKKDVEIVLSPDEIIAEATD